MEEEDETEQEQQQVLSFLDHVLANESEAEEEEILEETGEVHLAEPPSQSISQKKKDSGYGSQGHLKHEVISQVTFFSIAQKIPAKEVGFSWRVKSKLLSSVS